jgi:hypothetical protein
MAKPKTERNRLFIEDWQKGLSDQSLAKKYGLSIGGVKGLKARLRKKDPSLYADKRPELTKVEKQVAQVSGGLVKFGGKINKPSSKATSTTTQTSTSTKRMTFWLPESTIEEIKGLAAKEKRTASAILRGILGKYLKNK